MHPAERLARTLRHAPGLRHASRLWHALRPLYDTLIHRIGARGLDRLINGTDRIVVLPRLRGISEIQEPEVWAHLMSMLRPGDTFVDVGAHVGLYAIAVAQRMRNDGRVVAFEPEPENAHMLREHVRLNSASVEIIEAAVGAREGRVVLDARSSETQVSYEETGSTPCTTLDESFRAARVDILKIDVEGFEEEVLKGAARLLQDPHRRPRRIYIEIHPLSWERTGTTAESLLGLLTKVGYEVRHLNGDRVITLDGWEEVVAEPAGS